MFATRSRWRLAALCLFPLCGACNCGTTAGTDGGESGDSGTTTRGDGGVATDGGTRDAGSIDGGGSTDAGAGDAGLSDAGVPDGGLSDAGLSDGGTDAGRGDSGTCSTSGDVLYVDPVNGSDVTGTGALASPFQTLTHAESLAVFPCVVEIYLMGKTSESEDSGERFPIRLQPSIQIEGGYILQTQPPVVPCPDGKGACALYQGPGIGALLQNVSLSSTLDAGRGLVLDGVDAGAIFAPVEVSNYLVFQGFGVGVVAENQAHVMTAETYLLSNGTGASVSSGSTLELQGTRVGLQAYGPNLINYPNGVGVVVDGPGSWVLCAGATIGNSVAQGVLVLDGGSFSSSLSPQENSCSVGLAIEPDGVTLDWVPNGTGIEVAGPGQLVLSQTIITGNAGDGIFLHPDSLGAGPTVNFQASIISDNGKNGIHVIGLSENLSGAPYPNYFNTDGGYYGGLNALAGVCLEAGASGALPTVDATSSYWTSCPATVAYRAAGESPCAQGVDVSEPAACGAAPSACVQTTTCLQ